MKTTRDKITRLYNRNIFDCILWILLVFTVFFCMTLLSSEVRQKLHLRFYHHAAYKGGAEIHTPEDYAPYSNYEW
ncbi:hypothetical protein O0Q50_20610 [Priestia aryabhattai]|uniref:Uncharacterized protein n=1 Tax=Priestia aryabhattai TaxID=412384 RepID=A0AAX6NCJ3_PRIAR|nr:hypothetical protein [Priestia aryabhattai]MDU9693582.1 hypothetical protein [Priestia aryabhattai]